MLRKQQFFCRNIDVIILKCFPKYNWGHDMSISDQTLIVFKFPYYNSS